MFGVVVKLRQTYIVLKMVVFEFRDRVIIKPWRTEEGVGALILRKSRAQQSHDAAPWTRFRRGHLGRAGDILSPSERQGMFAV